MAGSLFDQPEHVNTFHCRIHSINTFGRSHSEISDFLLVMMMAPEQARLLGASSKNLWFRSTDRFCRQTVFHVSIQTVPLSTQA